MPGSGDTFWSWKLVGESRTGGISWKIMKNMKTGKVNKIPKNNNIGICNFFTCLLFFLNFGNFTYFQVFHYLSTDSANNILYYIILYIYIMLIVWFNLVQGDWGNHRVWREKVQGERVLGVSQHHCVWQNLPKLDSWQSTQEEAGGLGLSWEPQLLQEPK